MLSATPHITPSALAKVKALRDEEGNAALNLRVYVTGGGCSGFQYNFMFDEEIHEDDTIVGDDGKEGGSSGDGTVKLLVDPMSLQYLAGAEIDYKEDIDGEQFVIRNNPNAKTTCGCGSSFAA